MGCPVAMEDLFAASGSGDGCGGGGDGYASTVTLNPPALHLVLRGGLETPSHEQEQQVSPYSYRKCCFADFPP